MSKKQIIYSQLVEIFTRLDTTGTGFLHGSVASKLFSSSGVSQEILANVLIIYIFRYGF